MQKLDIRIRRKDSSYPVYISGHGIEKLGGLIQPEHYSQIAVITDTTIGKLFLSSLKKSLRREITEIIIPSGEEHKNLQSLNKIWHQLIQAKFDRKSLIINLGGGVICDMGGLAAATYMRGVSFIQVPTTLLAQVDASVGGKLAVDFEGYKNIIGSFAQPAGVVIDVGALETLPDREFLSGFAEIIKHGLIADKEYFTFVTSKRPREFSNDEMSRIIERSVKIKADVVEKDEQEAGLRKILNFGHTVGHAIESHSLKTDDPLLHGEAIAIGMYAEAKLSLLAGLLREQEVRLIQEKLTYAGLPTHYHTNSNDELMTSMKLDKKNADGKIKWTLLKRIGEAVFDVEVDDSKLSEVI